MTAKQRTKRLSAALTKSLILELEQGILSPNLVAVAIMDCYMDYINSYMAAVEGLTDFPNDKECPICQR